MAEFSGGSFDPEAMRRSAELMQLVSTRIKGWVTDVRDDVTALGPSFQGDASRIFMRSVGEWVTLADSITAGLDGIVEKLRTGGQRFAHAQSNAVSAAEQGAGRIAPMPGLGPTG